MQLTVQLEDLQKKSIFVATPMYGGMNHGLYMRSCLNLQEICIKHGIRIRFVNIFNESLITRARNYLVDEFLNRSDFTHLMFLDADISFEAMDVITLLAMEKDIVGGPYPKKAINWTAVKTAIEKNPNVEPEKLENVTGSYVFNMVEGGDRTFQVTEPLEVTEIGTGFMMIERSVFDRFKKAYPKLEYRPDHTIPNFDGKNTIHAFFDTVIDKDSERYLSEDYFFCQLWRKMGGSVFMCPWMKIDHTGTYTFKGDMISTAQLVGTL